MTGGHQKKLVILGGFEHEGLSSAAEAVGFNVLNRGLARVTHKTWLKRAQLLDELRESDSLAGTVIYLHTTLLLMASAQPYRDAFFSIVRSASTAPGLIFIFQDNLDGVFAERRPESNEPATLNDLENDAREWRLAKLRKDADAVEAIAASLTDEAMRLAQTNEDGEAQQPAVRVSPLQRIRPRTVEELHEDAKDELRRAEHLRQMAQEADTEILESIEIDWRLANAIKRLRDYENRKDEVDGFIRDLHLSGMDVAPFSVRSDVTIRLQQFLSDIDQGVFLRLFVLDRRVHSEHLRGLLAVLERYLRDVEGRSFSIDTRRSDHGVTYVFKSSAGSLDMVDLQGALTRFDSFMRVCGDDPESAAALLKKLGLSHEHALDVAYRLSRDYGRIVLDMRYELERRVLALRYRMETKVMDARKPISIMDVEGGVASAPQSASIVNVVFNSGSLSMKSAHDLSTNVDQSVTYNENDHQIIALLERYGEGLEVLEGRSDLDQLKDGSIPEPDRMNAKQRLVAAIKKAAARAGPAVEKIGTSVLTKYLESLLT